ncbi:MAG: hypothetical protein FWH26_08960, partial [Oscillospiraceae bacterium]|nr:hypothetical protein [Oscillospiraceae bacterium]
MIAALLLTLTACGVPFMGIKFITGDIEMRGGFSPPILGRSLSLEDIILMCEPRAAEFDVLITGYDGLAVRVAGEDLSCCELVYSKDYYWELRCDSHPPSVKVKNIKEIAVLSRSEDPYAARFLSDGKAQSLTAGQLLLHGAFTALQEEGTSKLNGKSVTVYTTKRRVALSTLLPDSERLYAVGFDGTAAYFRGTADCYLESAGNSVDLLLADGQVIADLAGVMAEPPAFTISETAVDALHFLERGERVMVLELDSLGWEMLQRAGEEYAPFLHSLQPQKALAAFPSDSKTGIAWMTGVSAPEGDLFQRAAKLGKSCVYIEGSQAFPGVSL